MDKQHKNITIFGDVQGVGFRFAARNVALKYGMNGFVENLPDGSVYIEIEGNTAQLESFIFWCKEGPSHATVNDMKIEDGEVKKFTEFFIKH